MRFSRSSGSTTDRSARDSPVPVSRRLWDAYRQEVERWLAAAAVRYDRVAGRPSPGARMTTTEESDDPFLAHFKRDPLPDAGIRIILLTDLPPSLPRPSSRRWSIRSRAGPGRRMADRPGRRGSAWRTSFGRGLEGADLPLVLVTTAEEPWTAGHLDPLLKAIDHCDHVIGRRPADVLGSWKRWLAFAAATPGLRRPAARRSLAMPAPSPGETVGDPTPVGILVPRHRDPGQGDLPRPLDR